MTRKPFLSAAWVKQSLAAHSWLGLACGVLMYLVCLSGTLTVFYPEFERWEQPAAPEMASVVPETLERAYRRALSAGLEPTHHMYLQLPRDDLPRAAVSSENQGWFLQPDGSLGAEVDHDWTHFLINLHLYLHLPDAFGMIVVSGLGALLFALILSGLLAHPRLFRDAFMLRRGGSRHLEQADLHNRLSVWGAPFHLMIALTGAYFGFAGLLAALFGAVWYEGDESRVLADAFGAPPAIQESGSELQIARALRALREIAPEARPTLLTIEDADSDKPWMVIAARHPERLIWAENYRFNADGDYLGKVGFSDGDIGRQAIYSVYRLHFGHFGGLPVKGLYALLGMALTIIAVSGINIWLARRRQADRLDDLWAGLVWGAPASLALSALSQVVLGGPGTLVFWGSLTGACALACHLQQPARTRNLLQLLGGALLLAVVAGHMLRFGGASLQGATPWVNGALTLSALALLLSAWRGRTPHS